ncbi:hypothetical protein [Vitiosangium sp. GDMCC 1.1324]|uniref:hypothetical protein n=1 Tax=Vitiosangium sp. (strain GDMCC 1.1324) TaxID=2138576 RepID=UPI000D379319|nr:hypothetical protein [Vitiosangium sp. GDMCC 1.1324]PTL83936.1 hypothetical protein DAT35_10780 [Vitiosangium sp. GDMCC 1.1324]
MRLNKSMMLGAVLVLAACGGSQVEDTEYVEATPDLTGTSLEINGDVADEGSKLTAEDFSGAYAQALTTQGPEFLAGARAEVKALNAALKDAITRITTLANGDLKEAQKGDVLVYGPKDLDNATFRLQVKKTSTKRFAWKLEARPLGSTDDTAWKLVGAGRLARGELAHRGRGTLALNLDNLKSVAPSTTGQGKLMASFAHTVGEDKTVSYRLVGFTPNPANHDPVTGAFVGYRLLPSRVTGIRVMGKWNLSSTATDAKENVFSRIRFRPGIGGRADVLASGGDIPASHVFIGSACWDAQEKEVFKILRDCVKGTEGQPGSCSVVFKEGDLLDCKHADFRGDVEPPAENPNDTAQEPGAPSETPDDVPGDVSADF